MNFININDREGINFDLVREYELLDTGELKITYVSGYHRNVPNGEKVLSLLVRQQYGTIR